MGLELLGQGPGLSHSDKFVDDMVSKILEEDHFSLGSTSDDFSRYVFFSNLSRSNYLPFWLNLLSNSNLPVIFIHTFGFEWIYLGLQH